MIFVVMRLVLKRSWLALGAGVIVLLLVAAATALFVTNIASGTPMTTNLSAWWSTPTTLSIGLLIGLACFAYCAARAGQPLFGTIINQ
jgi:hypothetical protein